MYIHVYILPLLVRGVRFVVGQAPQMHFRRLIVFLSDTGLTIAFWEKFQMRIHIVVLLSIVCCLPVRAQQTILRLDDLKSQIGHAVKVEGRTGSIEKDAVNGKRVFSLRDDFNDSIYVTEPVGDYEHQHPVMGVHTFVTGTVRSANGKLFVDSTASEIVRDPAFIQSHTVVEKQTVLVRQNVPSNNSKLVWIGILTAIAAAVVVYLVLKPKAVWGRLEVVNGHEKNAEFQLRGNMIPIGRAVKTGIRMFLQDTTVSRSQGVIIRKGNSISFQNASDKGTFVDGKLITGSDLVPLNGGSLIEMGRGGAMLRFYPSGFDSKSNVDDMQTTDIAMQVELAEGQTVDGPDDGGTEDGLPGSGAGEHKTT